MTTAEFCAGLEETQAGIKIARRNINNFRYADDTTLMAEFFKVVIEAQRNNSKINLSCPSLAQKALLVPSITSDMQMTPPLRQIVKRS